MTYIPYQCCQKSFEDYYLNQTGDGLNFYQGIPYQKGYGFGGLFRSFFRAAVPLFKSGAKTVGKQMLRTGLNVLNDISEGNSIKEASRKRFKESAHILTDKATHKLKNMIGSGKRNKKRRLARKPFISSRAKKVKAAPDIFT